MRTKCEACGASLKYEPKKGGLVCTFCKTLYQIDKKTGVPFISYTDVDKTYGVKMSSFCSNCGASVGGDTQTVNGKCRYCGSSLVLVSNAQTAEGIIPFKISLEDVPKIFHENLKKRRSVPKAFKKVENLGKVQARYLSLDEFSGNVISSYDGHLIKNVYNSEEDKYEDKSIYVNGNISMNFDDISTENCYKTADEEFDDILPYDKTEVYQFDEDFLVGYPIEKEECKLSDKFENVIKDKVDKKVRDEIVCRHNCDRVGFLNTKNSFNSVAFRRLYVPIYFVELEYKGKTYHPLLNGQTGRVGGKIPRKRPILAIIIFFMMLLVFVCTLCIFLK